MVDQEARANLEALNGRLTGKVKLTLAGPDDVVFLEKNARYMKQEKFQNLVANIRRDGALSSVPFCWLRDGKYEVLSGNHRVKAGFQAGLEEILVLYTDEDLSRSERVAIQLSHNSLAGEDDPSVLAELWEEIDDLALKYYTGLDDIDLGNFGSVDIKSLAEEALQMFTLTFMFFGCEAQKVADTLEKAAKAASAYPVYVATLREYDRLIEAMDKVKKSYNVGNAATAFMLLLDVFERHQEDLATGWQDEQKKLKRMVPISTVLGTDLVPVSVAQELQRELRRLGNPKNPEALLMIRTESTDQALEEHRGQGS